MVMNINKDQIRLKKSINILGTPFQHPRNTFLTKEFRKFKQKISLNKSDGDYIQKYDAMK